MADARTPEHGLTHLTVSDASGQRLTPGCVCGWYSPDGSHWRFERHMRRMKERTDG